MRYHLSTSPRRRFAHLLLVATLGLAALLPGCSQVKKALGQGGDKPIVIPPLPELTETSPIELRWSKNVGSGTEDQYLRITPAIKDGVVYGAGYDGEIAAFSAETGEQLWGIDTRYSISGGPAIADGLLVVGTDEGELVAFDATNGEASWTARLSSEILATPVIGEGVVVARTADGKVFGVNSADGARIWVYDRAVPALTLRGTSAPVLAGSTVISGFDSGRVVAIGLKDGRTVWDRRVMLPRGASELARMVDIDAEPLIVGSTVYVVTFQGRVVAMDIDTGEIIWRRDLSSHSGMSADAASLYVTDADSVVWSINRATSRTVWSQELLKGRALSGPAYFGGYVVVGDIEGYVHLMSAEDGSLLGRTRIDNEPIVAPPIIAGDTVFVLSGGGNLAALALP